MLVTRLDVFFKVVRVILCWYAVKLTSSRDPLREVLILSASESANACILFISLLKFVAIWALMRKARDRTALKTARNCISRTRRREIEDREHVY